jgi:D-alanyl-D-alanine carboxypeptidase
MNEKIFPFTREQVTREHTGIAVFSLVVCAVAISFFVPNGKDLPQAATVIEAPVIKKAFDDTRLIGKAAIVYDIATDTILFSENAETQLPLASLTKLITVSMATTVLGRERGIVISDEDLETEGDSGLLRGERWSVSDLAAFTLITSSNDGAASLVRHMKESAGEDSFNRTVSERLASIGLSQTYVVNGTGLDLSPNVAGAYGSATDIARLLAYMYAQEPELLAMSTEETHFFTSASGNTYKADNTNAYVHSIPGLLASKTGYTDLAGGNLALIVDVGLHHPVAVVVLGSTREGRFSDALRLIERTHSYFAYAN